MNDMMHFLMQQVHRIFRCNNCNWKKRSEETQTLCAGCSKAEPKFFDPPQTTSRRPKFNQLHYLYLQTQFGEAISSYRGNRPTNTPTHKPTDRTDYNTLHCSFTSAQCNE